MRFFLDLFSPLRLSDSLLRMSPAATKTEDSWPPLTLESVESADIMEIVSRSLGLKTAGYCKIGISKILQILLYIRIILYLQSQFIVFGAPTVDFIDDP